MDFDEYEYLENMVENPEPKNLEDKVNGEDGIDESREENGGRSSKYRRSSDERDDLDVPSKRSRSEKHSHDHEKDRRLRHHASSRDRDRGDKEKSKSSRDHRSRYKEDGGAKEKESEKDRVRDREKERERDSDKKRDSNKAMREHESDGREREMEGEVERSRHISGRSERNQNARGAESSRDKEGADKEFKERHKEREFRDRDHESSRKKDKKEGVDPPADPERDQRTVFAFQINMKADERDIYEFFSKAGKVRDVRLITERNTGRSRGVGYVEFFDVMSVPMAIALSGQPLLGLPMMVKPSEAEKNLVPPAAAGSGSGLGQYSGGARRLYVGNLPLTIKEDQIRQVFEPFGTVDLVQMPTDPVTGNCKGYAFVQFARLEDAKLAQNLNGQLEIAGQAIKVSTFTDQHGMQDAGANMADLDDDEGGGLSLNAHSRALLMQKLDRTGTASSINGSFENSIGQTSVAVHPGLPASSLSMPSTPMDTIGVPSECLLLKNMFDPNSEGEPDFDLDIKEDVHDECAKYGTLKHIYVEKNSSGFVYLRFETTQSAMGAQRALHGRWFAGKMITATFMLPNEYDAKFPKSS